MSRQFFVFLFFVALSAAFWLFNALEDSYEREFSVPIVLKDVPKNVVITTDLPASLNVVLKDRGATLLQYLYGGKLGSVVIDFNDVANYSGHVRLLGADLAKQVQLHLQSTTRISSFKPDTLEFFYNYGEGKRVPVRLKGEIKPEERFSISHISIRPDSVMVYAVPSVLDTLTAAYTTPLYLKDISDTVHLETTFNRVRGAKFVPNKVDLTFFVDQMTEKTVQVPIQWVNFPATKVLRTFPAKVNITFQVGTSMYRRIGPEQFVLVVNYGELINNTSGKCRLRLKTIPAGAQHVRIEPSEVDFLIEDVPSEN